MYYLEFSHNIVNVEWLWDGDNLKINISCYIHSLKLYATFTGVPSPYFSEIQRKSIYKRIIIRQRKERLHE